jgi:hypothetical protein
MRRRLAVGEMISEDPAQYVSMDLNPVIVGSRGEGYWVVDALIYLDAPHLARTNQI